MTLIANPQANHTEDPMELAVGTYNFVITSVEVLPINPDKATQMIIEVKTTPLADQTLVARDGKTSTDPTAFYPVKTSIYTNTAPINRKTNQPYADPGDFFPNRQWRRLLEVCGFNYDDAEFDTDDLVGKTITAPIEYDPTGKYANLNIMRTVLLS